jgi:hypothetical protein
MTINRRDFLKLGGGMALTIALASKVQWSGARTVRAAAALQMSDADMHVLNRLTWGVMPQDIDRIRSLGIEGYIDWQLNPESIDDPLIDVFMADRGAILNADFVTMQATTREDYGILYSAAVWGRIYRAAFSERQLYEHVVDFWTDHFNIPLGDYLVEKAIDDREVIRRHAVGKFRDLLFASAQSPAMLYYLDNAYSNAEHPNENYAREVMELHTLGVGNYSEDDVRALARILTGWGVNEAFGGGNFFFESDNHDYEEKSFLGRQFAAGRGVEEGLEALDMLATSPATAAYVTRKLVRRFVSDIPTDALVESATGVWLSTDGDIRAVLRHILLSSWHRRDKSSSARCTCWQASCVPSTHTTKSTTRTGICGRWSRWAICLTTGIHPTAIPTQPARGSVPAACSRAGTWALTCPTPPKIGGKAATLTSTRSSRLPTARADWWTR